MNIKFAEILRTGAWFSIGSVLNENGRPTEKRVFLPANNMRVVTTFDNGDPFIRVREQDFSQVEIGTRILYVQDNNWDPSMGKYPNAFVWGIWDEVEEEVVPPPPEPVVSVVSVPEPAPYSTPHSGGARRKSRAQRRHRQATGTPIGDNQVAEVVGSSDTESAGTIWPTERGHYDPDHYQVGLAEGMID